VLLHTRFNGQPSIAVTRETTPSPASEVPEPVTIGTLTQLAVLHPDGWDAVLGNASRNLLPHVERIGNTLHVLAKIDGEQR
jgi:hypothetical protein